MSGLSGQEVNSIGVPSTVIVWDLPVRLVHWSLATAIGLSWWSAETGQIEWHLRSGYAILFLVLFRLLWGLFGGTNARFASFIRGPGTILSYLRDAASWRGSGHTPLGALSVVALLVLIGVQVGTGLVMSDEDGLTEGPLSSWVGYHTSAAAFDVHKASFNVLLGFIALHLAAILFYSMRRKPLVVRMITGRAQHMPGSVPARSGSLPAAFACVLLAGALTAWLIAGAPLAGR